MTQLMGWAVLQSQVAVFGEKLTKALKELDIYENCKNLQLDHICVRLKNNKDVANLKQELSVAGQIISSVNVNGREISIIELARPLHLGLWQTSGVELPYPKTNHNYIDGWEHVEFVLKVSENTMGGIREALTSTFTNLDMEKLKVSYGYSENEPRADGDQLPNPTIGMKVNGVGIKFHANPIQVVVGYK